METKFRVGIGAKLKMELQKKAWKIKAKKLLLLIKVSKKALVSLLFTKSLAKSW